MSILKHIRKVPLFSTPLEAIAWGRSRRLKGYHSHAFGSRTGYMGGANHRQAVRFYLEPTARGETAEAQQVIIPVVDPPQQIVQPTQNASVQRIIPPSTGSSSGGGGGGGGY